MYNLDKELLTDLMKTSSREVTEIPKVSIPKSFLYASISEKSDENVEELSFGK